MPESLLIKLVRNFPENGPKLLLANSANVHDLLVLVGEPHVDSIEFEAMTVERSHFVQPDYAHVALDMLFKAPFRLSAGDPPRTILIYVLVEHQSRPQRFFMLRLAEYLLEAYKMQKRAWDEKHSSDAQFSLQPVLPIVLYTGDRNWEKIDTLADVIEAGKLFETMIPAFKPHFLNLRRHISRKTRSPGRVFRTGAPANPRSRRRTCRVSPHAGRSPDQPGRNAARGKNSLGGVLVIHPGAGVSCTWAGRAAGVA